MDIEEDHIRLPDLVPAIVHRLPAILAEVRELLAERQPDYAGFLADGFEEILGAAEGFIARLVTLAEQDPSTAVSQLASAVEQALFEEIGRIHYQQQRDVTPLLAAYRTGAAVTWRHVADTALELGVPAEALAGLAAAVFAAVDQLSSASWRGYVQAQTAAGQARERLRDELAELLVLRPDITCETISGLVSNTTSAVHARLLRVAPPGTRGTIEVPLKARLLRQAPRIPNPSTTRKPNPPYSVAQQCRQAQRFQRQPVRGAGRAKQAGSGTFVAGGRLDSNH